MASNKSSDLESLHSDQSLQELQNLNAVGNHHMKVQSLTEIQEHEPN